MVTDDGIAMLVSAVQFLKVFVPRVCKLEGRVIDANLTQSSNTPPSILPYWLSIVVTLLGREILTRFVHPLNVPP